MGDHIARPDDHSPSRLHPLALTLTGIGLGAALGVLLAGTIHFVMREGEGAPFAQTAWQQALYFGLWGAIVVPLLGAVDRVERVAQPATRALLYVILGVVAWVAHSGALFAVAVISSSQSRSVTSFVTGAMRMIYIESIVYAAVLGGILAIRHRERARTQERRAAALALQLSRSRLQTLQSRLQPHFLFNALHTVGMLARAGDTSRVVDVTARLGGLLRAMLDDDDTWETTLRDELDLVNRYLAIELIRFQDRLDVTIDADVALGDALVPRFVLQPLVENAMRHGISHRTDRGRIAIVATRVADSLVVAVTDDGPGLAPLELSPAATNGQSGLGLRITRERLNGMYGDAGLLDVSGNGDGTTATVTVPWHTVPIEVNAS